MMRYLILWAVTGLLMWFGASAAINSALAGDRYVVTNEKGMTWHCEAASHGDVRSMKCKRKGK